MTLSALRTGSRLLLRTAGTAAVAAVLTGLPGAEPLHAAPPPGKPYPILPSCTNYDSWFAKFDFDQWPDIYHSRVNNVVEEYLQPPEDIQCLDPVLLPLDSSSSLATLAAQLPPWEDPADLANLDRNDVGIVLLEFLRIYECSLVDHNYYLPMDIINEYFQGGPFSFTVSDFIFDDLLKEMGRRRRVIAEEIAVSRPAMEQILVLVSSITRLSPLDAELQCLQRASLDLRNGLGLAADASVCMPRAWDVKDVLRDL